ncbi:MAG TPA: choice-of-anchor D domain-containing protein, partial [Candidatus Syntrophosphaera sp.]|nr:choice-of-anchor D domain-containing protein [Candidatus Syntrophosphaera sp.]
TSCATPYVAGSAALILSRDASLTPSQLRAVMTSTATDMTADGGAGWDRYTGYGMVNVYSAITSLSAYNPPLGLIAIAGNAVVTLNWQPPATGTPVNYKIYKNSVLLTTTTELTYTDTNVVNGITYAYFLKAVYSEGESDPTATVYATPSPVSYAILGSGSSTTNNNQLSPINNTFKSIHGQSVYTAAELNAAGIYGPKMLTKFGFYPVSQPNLALVNFIVRMKHTTQTDASTWDDGSNLTTVYSNTAYMPTVGGYDMLTLTTPFEWNGTDNILIDTAFGMLANYSQTGTLQYTSVNNGYCRVGDDNTNQTNLFTGGAVRNFRPNVRLGFEAIVLGPIIAVDPASLAFGTQQVGTSAVLPFTIHNTGDQTLSGFISSPAGFSVAQARGAEDMEISANAGSSGRNTILYSIAAGVTKTYNLTFTPTAANTYSGNVVISSNDSGSPSVNIAVSGSGYIPPTIVLNPVSLEVSLHSGESASDGFEVANGGSQTLNFVISEMPPVDWFSASPMIGTVPGSGSQPVSCSFSAAGLLPGIYETLLQIASNDPINPLSEISIILNVLNYAPEIDVPESFSFDMDGSLVVDFSPFVSDPDNQDLILGCSGNANVQVSIDGMAVTFTAAAGWSGSEELTFSVSDGIDQSFDTATVTVNLVSLAQPEILAITKSAGGILIEWEPVANAAQFKIYRATEPDGDFILLATTTQNSYEDTAALDKAFYRIVADSVPPAK